MIRIFNLTPLAGSLWRNCRNEKAAQIVEFAVSLPLLVLFVIGIFDFTGALTLKQKLTNAAREAARIAAADPGTDLGAAVPVSVSDAFQVLDNYLLAEKINDCGLSTKTPSSSALLTWSASSTTGCPGIGIVFTINRGCMTLQSVGGVNTEVVNTCVTVQYAYQWRITGISGVLGNSLTGPSSMTASAAALNEN